MEKTAIELTDGDMIRRLESCPAINLYRGTVKNIVVVDRGVQINYVGGTYVIVPENEIVEVN
jgi:hypothetical protein